MICVECGSLKIENRELKLCGTCNKFRRKVDMVKLPEDPKPIAKVSDVQSKLLQKYAQLKKKFMLNRWCAYHGKPCLPTDIHHSAGRVGVDENGVPMLLATQYFVPVCRIAHQYIEEHPKWAKENGFSENRLLSKASKEEEI